MKKYLFLLAAVFYSFAAAAQPVYEGGYNPEQNMNEYFQEANANYDKSIIYVFFNNNPCYQCPQTIDMIEEIYNQYYKNQYSLLLINYENDQEYNFIETYNLSKPLEVVLVRVDDGATFGYKKLDNLSDMTSDPTSFSEYFQNQVNEFLGNGVE